MGPETSRSAVCRLVFETLPLLGLALAVALDDNAFVLVNFGIIAVVYVIVVLLRCCWLPSPEPSAAED